MLKFANKIPNLRPSIINWTKCRHLSHSQALRKATQTDKVQKHDKTANVSPSASTSGKLPKRDPFVKNFFLGIVDKEILTYPEVLSKEEVDDLERSVDKFATSYQHQVCGNKMMSQPELVASLSSLQVFGSSVSKDFDGMGRTATEYCLFGEKEANDMNLAARVNAHRVVTSVLEKYGSDEQKEKYLRKLATGELVGSMAIFEDTVPEDGFFNTTAQQDFNDDNAWLLNGQKSFVTNCPNASLLVVICQTVYKNRDSDLAKGVSAFLVETSAGQGVSVTKLDETLGLTGANQATISFENTMVPASNILGKLGSGSDVAMHALQVSRLQSGVMACTLMKQIINHYTDYCNDPKRTGMQLKENDLIKIRCAKTICAEYALESMIYLTAGLYDSYERQDIELEAAILKVFAVENALRTAIEPFYTFGPGSLLADNPIVENARNAMQLLGQGETLDSLKVFIALSGLQHAGSDLHDMVTRVRNPLMHPKFVLSKIFSGKNIDDPKTTLNLNYNLHPSLDPAAQSLEYSTIRFQIATETLLSRYGAGVVDKATEVTRLTDAVVLLYAMYAATARASRAYCIGLRNADYEMLLANTFCLDNAKLIWQLVKDIDKGTYELNDYNYEKVGKKLFESKKYFLEHPLTRNF